MREIFQFVENKGKFFVWMTEIRNTLFSIGQDLIRLERMEGMNYFTGKSDQEGLYSCHFNDPVIKIPYF